MSKQIGEIVTELEAAGEDRAKMVRIIRENKSKPLATLFMAAFGHPVPVFKPGELPPYNENKDPVGLTFTNMAREMRKLEYFFKPGRPMARDSLKRLYINICEGLHPKEADIFTKVITKRFYVKGLDYDIINEGFGETFLTQPKGFKMLNETLLSFNEWREMLISEGADMPEDVQAQQKLYESYTANFHAA